MVQLSTSHLNHCARELVPSKTVPPPIKLRNEMNTPQTDAARLSADYLKLGGKRRGKLDDNIIDTRKWDDEPEEGRRFGTDG